MKEKYNEISKWFNNKYGNLGFSLENPTIVDGKHKCYLVKNGEMVYKNTINYVAIYDASFDDEELLTIIFEKLFNYYGYNINNLLCPLKQVKEFKL